jgi:hypothetical protein
MTRRYRSASAGGRKRSSAALLRTHDILVGDSDPALFVIDLQGAKKLDPALSVIGAKKLIFKVKFFFLLLFLGTLKSFSKDKKSKRSHKTVKTKGFLTIFA